MYRYEKNKGNGEIELIIDGFDKGIANSPHKGISNMQGVNIATESGEAMCSFNRIIESQVGTTGTITQVDTDTVSISDIDLLVGQVITILSDSGTGLSGNYYYLSTGKLFSGSLPPNDPDNATAVSGINSGTATFSVTYPLGNPIQSATEIYFTGNQSPSLLNGLLAYYEFNNGTLENDVLGTYNFTNSGGVINTPSGIIGYGADFGNPNGGNYLYNNAIVTNTFPLTISGWFNPGIVNDNGNIWSLANSGGSDYYQLKLRNTDSHIVFRSNNNIDAGDNDTGIVATVSTWYNYVVIINSTTSVTIYINNVLTNSAESIFPASSLDTFSLGALGRSSPLQFYSGLEDEVGLWNRGLTSSEVGMLYNSGAAFQYPFGSIKAGGIFYRYYILDSLGNVWCHDTATLSNWDTPEWFFVGNAGVGATGLAVLNGWLFVTNMDNTYWKLTVLLGDAFINTNGFSSLNSSHPRVSLTNNKGVLFVSDGNNIASFYPNTSLINVNVSNIQSYFNYNAVSDIGTIISLIGGSNPTVGVFADRIPAIFFTDGTLPSAITASTIYWIEYNPGPPEFKVYAAVSGGSALDIETGSTGNQYVNTFDPTSDAGRTMMLFSLQNLFLPFYEVVTSMASIDTSIVIGGISNSLYLWNGVDAQYQSIIYLPENNTKNIITVNNMAYIFAGNKGNIYITNGSAASKVISVPDYCAGIPGTPFSYIEPYFKWGGAMYVRGRVWFSILDQTSTKAGNCGGIWSFTPTQNFFAGDDSGLALRLENQSSYETYNGVSDVLLASQEQNAIAPQYWSGWMSDINSPTYGIDFTDTIPQQFVIETDLIPTGTMLQVKTFNQIEYKLSSPLVSGDTISLNYRQNSTDEYVSCGTVEAISDTALSGYVPMNFQEGQWIQFQIIGTPIANASSSFCRFKELIVR